MGNWKKHYSSEHLDAGDIPDGRDVTVKITRIGNTEIDGDKGKERKMLVTFEPSPGFARLCNKRTWVPAKTCGYCLEAMFGSDDSKWVGRLVTLHVEPVDAFGETVDAVRVKGSPELERIVKIRVRKGRGKATIELHPTAKAPAAQPASPAGEVQP